MNRLVKRRPDGIEVRNSWSVGRSRRRADIVVDHLTVSAVHARIHDEGAGSYRLEDLGSTNGTYQRIGDRWRAIQSVLVGLDDPIALGDLRTTVRGLLERAGRSGDKDKSQYYRDPDTGAIIRSRRS